MGNEVFVEKKSGSKQVKAGLLVGLALCMLGMTVLQSASYAQAAATPAAKQLGTIKSVSGSTLTLTTDAGQSYTVTVAPDAKIVALPVGSTDLKTATPSQLSDITIGDRALVTGKPGDTPTTFSAARVILMKSGDIAQKNATEQAEWKKNGTGGIVSAIDSATGAITVTAGAKKIVVSTSSKTDFKRFAGDSVKFQDAKPGAMAQIQVGDQIQARGAKSDDGLTIKADAVVSGSFKNLSGLVTSVDPATGKIALKDLATKKTVTVAVTANADMRKMPTQMATAFAARQRATTTGAAAATPAAADAGGAGAAAGGMRRAGGGGAADLAQMLARLPTDTLTDIKSGDAVMIVASEPSPGSSSLTAITVLTGVEPILTANPNGGLNLSAWSMGGGAAE